MLGELAKRDDVVALAFHVTYWDRLGWPDEFANPAHDQRQLDYAARLKTNMYTPQMVIAGSAHVVGGHPGIPGALNAVTEEISPDTITIGDDGRAELPEFSEDAVELWAAAIDRHESVVIERGENSGKTLDYHHIVRDYLPLDTTIDRTIPLPMDRWRKDGRDLVVVVAQETRSGRVLAIGRKPLDR